MPQAPCRSTIPLLFFFAIALLWTSTQALNLGIDFGTSGVRSCLITTNKEQAIVHESAITWSTKASCDCFPTTSTTPKNPELKADCPQSWRSALHSIITSIPAEERVRIERICISGTSSTTLLFDANNDKFVTRRARMYNYSILDNTDKDAAKRAIECIKKYAPAGSPTLAATSTLAKLLMWHFEQPLSSSERLAHQSDFCADLLVGSAEGTVTSDWHNALKLGYDVGALEYPAWLLDLLSSVGLPSRLESHLLPSVVEPGQTVGCVDPSIAAALGLAVTCEVAAGTTDSIAAFIASGADTVGQAVTSLGSTIAIKALSEVRVDDPSRGIYSHRLSDCSWLVGGASNAGCAVLRQEGFSNEELVALSSLIDPEEEEDGSSYYPLCKPGERFPVNDPHKQPILDPKPTLARGEGGAEGGVVVVVDRRRYLQRILQSLTRVEKEGYAALSELGASPVTQIMTAGGGAKNGMWTRMRSRAIGIECVTARNVDAAFGAARLAAKYSRHNS